MGDAPEKGCNPIMSQEHWQYYLSVEDDFLNTRRYVEIIPDNFTTYSIEYTRLLLSIGSETDVLCKLLCSQIDPTAQPKKILDYKGIILGKYPRLTKLQIHMTPLQLSYIPWAGWENASPSWWRDYNTVKHSRHQNYQKANLRNVLESLSGLLVLNLYFHKEEYTRFTLLPASRLIPKKFEGPLKIGGPPMLLQLA